jgi:hypothetical protein
MAVYEMTCAACGAPFTAKRRHANYCSQRCQQRMKYEGGMLYHGEAKKHEPCTPLAGSDEASKRLYRLYRGRLDRFDEFIVGDHGAIVSGYLCGRTLREVMQTAAREGWLAYRRRPDGWYSAEWADGRIALCGPRQLVKVPNPSFEADGAPSQRARHEKSRAADLSTPAQQTRAGMGRARNKASRYLNMDLLTEHKKEQMRQLDQAA